MAKKKSFSFTFDTSVAASSTDLQTSPVVASGKTIRLKEFGWSCQDKCLAALQWGSGSTWESIRGGFGNMDLRGINKDFIGDGSSRFRLVRQNSDSSSHIIVVWLEAVVLDDYE